MDVRLVQKYLDCLGKTKLLPLKLLSIKLAMLFALSCPERTSSFTKLDLSHCHVVPEGVFPSHMCLRECEALQINTFVSFPHNERLCPVGTLCPYLKATQNTHPLFMSSKPDPLFLMSNHIIQSLLPLLADG